MNKRIIAGSLTAALVGAPLALAVAAPAHADLEQRDSCSRGGNAELSVDREGKGFELDVDIDTHRAGDRWQIAIRHDGKLVSRVVRTTDREGEVDRELYRPNTKGKDAFVLWARNLETGSVCDVRVTTR